MIDNIIVTIILLLVIIFFVDFGDFLQFFFIFQAVFDFLVVFMFAI